jgi:hypothetical protein
MPTYISPHGKPKIGSACNHCGYCCAVQPCEIANEFLGAERAGVCPALERDGATGATACGMIVRPLHYLLADDLRRLGGSACDPALQPAHEEISAGIAHALGAGRGCDADDDENSIHWPWIVMLAEAR